MVQTARKPSKNSDKSKSAAAAGQVSWQSLLGLNAANFFLAELSGVVIPFLNDFLKDRNWRYDAIGVATALAGLGVLVAQTPAGMLVDRVRQRRALLAGASLIVGLCYGVLPLVPAHWGFIDPLVFLAGASNAFFGPLLGALALGLVGYAGLCKTVGINQSWNHAGNIAAAASAMALVSVFNTSAVFYAVPVVSVLAVVALLLIRPGEINEARASGASEEGGQAKAARFSDLFADRRIVVLCAATALFHLANAPVMPLVALYIRHLDGTSQQVGAVVLVAQIVMVPVALLAGWLCERWGRKPVLAIGFVVLPLRIFLYSLTKSPSVLIALQTLDGIGAGIYGVAIVAMCADLTRGKGRFNALSGLLATALAVGGVIGPLCSGFLIQYLGFAAAFDAFAVVAALAAALFLLGMPETQERNGGKPAPAAQGLPG